MASDGASERTPLLAPGTPAPRRVFPPLHRVFLTSFFISMTFSLTQPALIYSFRTMTCDEYYKTHEWSGHGDRCDVEAVASAAAANIALMSSVTTGCTMINLFTSAWFISRFGVKAAMFQQTAWAALRNLTQIYAQTLGGGIGMRIIQTTQLFNILGSGGGFQLCANSYVAALSSDAERTANFGVIGGVFMLGSAAGFSVGGAAQTFGDLVPFQAAFGMLCACTLFGMFFLPYYAPDPRPIQGEKKRGGVLSPLRVFVPRKQAHSRNRDWNLFFLGAGTFFSVLATGYVAMALQLVATDVFHFKPKRTGLMLSLTLLVRAFFLSMCFPRIIARGRAWVARLDRKDCRRSSVSSISSTSSSSSSLTVRIDPAEHPDYASEAEVPDAVGQPTTDLAPTAARHGATFDLWFLRYSILLDGVLTGAVTFVTRDWHIFAAAAVLPFASGTGPAAKGVTLEFVPPDQRADALSAIALVEKIAQVSTIGIFGYAFSLLSTVGRPTWVFSADAAIAFLAFMLLLPVRMPRAVVGGV